MNLPERAAELGHLVCDGHGVGLDEVLGRDRHRRVSVVRGKVVAAWRREGYGLSEIGRWLGRHHTSVLHMLRMTEWREEDLFRRRSGAFRVSFKAWDDTRGEKKP